MKPDSSGATPAAEDPQECETPQSESATTAIPAPAPEWIVALPGPRTSAAPSSDAAKVVAPTMFGSAKKTEAGTSAVPSLLSNAKSKTTAGTDDLIGSCGLKCPRAVSVTPPERAPTKTCPAFNFSYICPDPVLANVLVQNGTKKVAAPSRGSAAVSRETGNAPSYVRRSTGRAENAALALASDGGSWVRSASGGWSPSFRAKRDSSISSVILCAHGAGAAGSF